MAPEEVHRQVRTALLLGSGLEVAEEILAPALREMGRRWHEGTLAIAAEHLGAEAVGNALRDLLRLAQPPSTAPLAVLACVLGEEHTLPLYLVGLRLAAWGHRVEVLGSGLSPEALAVAIDRLDPDLVGLSVTRPPEGGSLQELLQAYARTCAGRPWVVGGGAAEQIRTSVESAGGWVASSPDELQQRLESSRAIKRSVR
jgi:methanogenic corrinoid protein MtbC1